MDLRTTLELNKKKFEEETLNEKTYKHILDRLNQEKIAFEVHSNDLHKQLKSASELLENEKLKSRKNYEAISLSKNSLKTLRICAEYDHRQKDAKQQARPQAHQASGVCPLLHTYTHDRRRCP